MKGGPSKARTTYAGKVLTENRLRAGISQMDLAYMAEMTLRSYQRLEVGDTALGNTRLRFGLAICAILDIDPYMIVFNQDSAALKKWLLE